jgi:hypothetical protein
MRHLRPFMRLSPPGLPVELTGITAVKAFMLTLPERTVKAETLVHHCANVIPGVLNAIALSYTGFKPMMKRDHLSIILRDAQLMIPTQCRRAREFHPRFVASLLTKIDLCEPRWLQEAEKLCDRWAKFNSHGYQSFLRHEGTWETAVRGAADFNQDFLKEVSKDLNLMFDELCDKGLGALQLEMAQTLSENLDEMESQFKASLDVGQFPAFQDFFENIRKQKNDIEISVKQANKTSATELQYVASLYTLLD